MAENKIATALSLSVDIAGQCRPKREDAAIRILTLVAAHPPRATTRKEIVFQQNW